MQSDFQFSYLTHAVVFAVLGIAIYLGAVAVLYQVTPRRWREALTERQDVPLAIVFAAVAIGLALIVAAAVH